MQYMIQAIFVVFLLTFGVAGGYYAFFGAIDPTSTDPKLMISYLIFGLVGMWTPGIAALFFAKKEGIKLKVFQKPDRMVLLASLGAIGICAAAFVLGMFFHQWKELEAKTIGLMIGSSLINGFTIIPLYALGEELFWRGYLHEKLRHLGLLKASFIIGSIWGIWHAPFILLGVHYPDAPVMGMIVMMLLCLASSPLFFWFRERGKSILVPTIFHAMLNSFAGMSSLIFQQLNPFLTEQGIPGIIVFTSVSMFLVFREKKKLQALYD